MLYAPGESTDPGAAMNSRTKLDVSTASNLLSLSETDVAQFIRQCVRNRSLSAVMTELNDAVLFGSREESDRARRALEHIGFSDT